MNDKTITITIKANASQLQRIMKEAGNSLGAVADDGKKQFGKLQALAVAAGTVIARAFEQIVSAVARNIGDAVKRVDILNNFPKVMSNVGIGADDARAAIQKLAGGLQGLPTALDTAAQAVQGLTMKTQDVDKATEIYLAFNNALLAGGAPMERQSSAAIQFSQAFARGKPDLIEWRALMETMPAQMHQLAQSFDQVDALALYEQVKDGNVTMDDFANRLIELNSNGIGGLPNFAEQAKNATGGIQTNFANMQIAITRGITKVIEAVGSENIANAVTAIGKGFEFALTTLADFVTFAIEKGGEILNWLRENETLVRNVAIVIGTLLLPQIVAIGIQSTIAFAKYLAGLGIMIAQTAIGAVRMAASWLLAMGPIGLIVAAVIGLAVLIIANWDTVKGWLLAFWEWIKGAALGAWEGIKAVFSAVGGWFKGVFEGAWNGIKAIFCAVGGFFRGVWDTITGIFGKIGKAVGDAIGGAFKTVVNSIIGFAESTVNGFIKAINGAIGLINKIPGVNIGLISELKIPRMATGGIVPATPGGKTITVAEGGQAEWVVPESKMASLISQVAARAGGQEGGGVSGPSIVIQAGGSLVSVALEGDAKDFDDEDAITIAKMIQRALRSQGLTINELGALR